MILYELLISIAIMSITLPTIAHLMNSINQTQSNLQIAISQTRETQFISQVLRSQLKDTITIQQITPTTIKTTDSAGELVEYGLNAQKIYLKKGLTKVNYSDRLSITQFNITSPAPKLITISFNNTPITIYLPNVP